MNRPPSAETHAPSRFALAIAVALLALLLTTGSGTGWAQERPGDAAREGLEGAEPRDAVDLRFRLGEGQPTELRVVGRLEGPPRGRPSAEFPRAGLPHPISLEVAIVDPESSVIEVHLFRGSNPGSGTGPDADNGAGADEEAPFAKLLLEPGIPGAAWLDDGTVLHVEVLTVGSEESSEPESAGGAEAGAGPAKKPGGA